ncbi:formimidoylglutamate deiminase [soil metagenome]
MTAADSAPVSQPGVIEADWTWTGERFESGLQIRVDPDGRIGAVDRLGLIPSHRLARVALLPGFVNAHSHAFQRGLRGHGERFPAGAGSFWTWREAMYGLVALLDARSLSRWSERAFREMRDAGITSVGEFHYLHHSTDDADYAFDRVVLEAAARVGIRIVLLNAFYSTGGIGQALSRPQRRFRSHGRQRYWDHMDGLSARLDGCRQSLGVVAHSIRAASVDDIASLHEESRRRGLPFHMHVEEQRREVEECVAAYGRRPMQILNEVLRIEGDLTAVHCTHTAPDDLMRFVGSGGTVCVCPLTEANLGDGLPALVPVSFVRSQVCLGTDSNARISLVEEMRWLEYGQRLRNEARGLLADRDGRAALTVLRAGTVGGARALGLEAGVIEKGHWADFAAIDLDHPALAECDVDNLLEAILFGADNGVILGTCVGGQWLKRRGEELGPEFRWAAVAGPGSET